MKYLLIVCFSILLIFKSYSQKFEYPPCQKKEVIDTFFNYFPVKDDYRWLENVENFEVKTWVKEQNKLFNKFIRSGTTKFRCKHDLDRYSCTETNYSAKHGKYYFSYKIRNGHASAGLYFGEKTDEVYDLLVDPNYNTNGKKKNIRGFSVSKDSQKLCYLTSEDGSDWMEARVINLPSGAKNKDLIQGIKYSTVKWYRDGFFYSKYPFNGKFSTSEGEEVYYHKLGESQSQDKLIFKRKNPNASFSYKVSFNERFFVLEEEVSDHFNYFFIDYESEQPYLRPLLMKQSEELSFIDSNNGKFIVKTFLNNNCGSVVEIDPYAPYQWREIVPAHSDAILTKTRVKENCILCVFQTDHQPIIKMYDFNGKTLHTKPMPIASSVYGFDGHKNEENLVYYNECYTLPKIQYYFNTNTFETKNGEKTHITYHYKNYEYKLLKYTTKDGTKVPLTLVYKKGLKLDGNNPTLLKTYGGFGSISTPKFDPGIVYFIEQGGLFAYANIRGGGYLGFEWAEAGRRLNKQNSINDFNEAAEFLIAEKYTNPKRLAITGTSHGGLIVTAAAIQRPELYAAVVPIVAVTDMLRFEKFTVGNFHLDEFGTVKDSLDFLNLRQYSPLHNIKKEMNYPAMLVMTSENDDRVPPFHSYKFVAALQNRSSQKNPILMRVEPNAGHGGANSKVTEVDSKSDMFRFIMKVLTN